MDILEKRIYTAEASATGGRAGHAISDDRFVDLDLRVPTAMGGPGGGTNPEQLFAAGYAACFQGAMGVVASKMDLDIADSVVTGKVTIGPIKNGEAFGIAVELAVELPTLDRDKARELVEAAHQVCPYSNATRGNVDVTLTVVDHA